jgi:hypothetical protein
MEQNALKATGSKALNMFIYSFIFILLDFLFDFDVFESTEN